MKPVTEMYYEWSRSAPKHEGTVDGIVLTFAEHYHAERLKESVGEDGAYWLMRAEKQPPLEESAVWPQYQAGIRAVAEKLADQAKRIAELEAAIKLISARLFEDGMSSSDMFALRRAVLAAAALAAGVTLEERME